METQTHIKSTKIEGHYLRAEVENAADHNQQFSNAIALVMEQHKELSLSYSCAFPVKGTKYKVWSLSFKIN